MSATQCAVEPVTVQWVPAAQRTAAQLVPQWYEHALDAQDHAPMQRGCASPCALQSVSAKQYEVMR